MVLKVSRPGIAAVVSITLVASALFWFGTGLNPIWWITWWAPLPILFLAARVSGGLAAAAAFCAFAIGSLNEWHYGRDLLEMPFGTALLPVLVPALIFASAVMAWRFFLKRARVWEAAWSFRAFGLRWNSLSSVYLHTRRSAVLPTLN